MFASINAFLASVDVVENELIDPASLPDPLRAVLLSYYERLDRYRLLTYGQLVVRAVEALEEPETARQIREPLQHLIVDEYQDVNPAQERLIHLLAGDDVELCVVGDDHQAIYQWRGSDVSNIVDFRQRYSPVTTFEITTNRRSRPTIIDTANQFAESIVGGIRKTMLPFRPATEGAREVVLWRADSETEEAGWIAGIIDDLVRAGTTYRDIAILVRTRAAYPRLVEQFASFDIPVQPGGRSGLFDQPEALVLGKTIVWLTDTGWRAAYNPSQDVTDEGLLQEYEQTFELSPAASRRLRRFLQQWKAAVPRTARTANLVGEFYELLDELEVRDWDLDDPIQMNRLGTLARFSSLLVDYETVRRRARPDDDVRGEQVGGQDRGTWYYKNLGLHIINHAQDAYEGFDGEAGYALDAVDLLTVHRAKGLEWPAVFVPSLTSSRFPSSKSGRPQKWLIPRDRFPVERYEGSDLDERRLFYVAMTRARDWLSVSRHERVTTRATSASPYYRELSHLEVEPGEVRVPQIHGGGAGDDDPISITYSEMASFLDCGMAFRLRNLIGFQPRLAPELGYGKAVHHVMRAVAERTRARGSTPSEAEIEAILNSSFFLPTANKPAHRALKDSARKLVQRYVSDYEADLYRVWETERPFELHLDGVVIKGRADVILDHEGGVPTGLAIVDYKTSTDGEIASHALQLQVYADAGRREGLDVRGAYVHDLKAARREAVSIDQPTVESAEATVRVAADRLRARDYSPTPGRKCRACEVRTVCRAAQR